MMSEDRKERIVAMKILLMNIEQPGIATWLFYIYFHLFSFFGDIFCVYICETYATLDTTKG